MLSEHCTPGFTTEFKWFSTDLHKEISVLNVQAKVYNANREFPCLRGGSLEITLTVPLSGCELTVQI